MTCPTSMQALSMGARAAGRKAWLTAPALIVTFLSWALTWPAPILALWVAASRAASSVSAGLPSPEGVLAAAARAVSSPRTLLVVCGLWLSAQLLSAALRAAWISGALPTLGSELARSQEARPTFVEGVAFGLPSLLATALLGALLELLVRLLALGVAAIAAVLALKYGGGRHPLLAALLGATALTGTVALWHGAALAVDAALARTAISGDPAPRAMVEGVRRVVLRPGAFFFTALALGAASLALLGAASALETAVLGIARGAPALLVVGPRLMASVMFAAVAALLDLWRLGTVAALACAEE